MKGAFRVWGGEKMWYHNGDLTDEEFLLRMDGVLIEEGEDETGSGRWVKCYWSSEAVKMFDTGSVDKNDKPIYDNDIVNWNATGLNQILWRVGWNSEPSRHIPHGWMLYHMAYEEEHSFIHLSVACAGWLYPGHDWMPEVVGNTYENSELMKGE